jgi:Uri superfamily endonuclease
MSVPGTYALLLRLDTPKAIEVGALGVRSFPAGWYLYLGSARGPGGLAARIARHRRRSDKCFHWHIDYARAVMSLVEVWSSPGESRQECRWATAAAELPGANVIVPGFGASDCRCPSHLIHYTAYPEAHQLPFSVQAELEREIINTVNDGESIGRVDTLDAG